MLDLGSLTARIVAGVDRDRLIATAARLVAAPSPTCQAEPAAEALEQILEEDGFDVQRIEAGHKAAPAVVVRFDTGQPGPTLQFNGHLDTVHLPFVPPRVEGGQLRGSGASDMKSGVAAAVEALRLIRAHSLIERGSILLTAHDLHEAPWGLGQQLEHLIRAGYVGDAVLLPEPLCDRIPIAGRGSATWKVTYSRPGEPIHEVMRPEGEPSVIFAGAYLVAKLEDLSRRLSRERDTIAGASSVFIGQIHSGEIFNQFPKLCWLEGTRRWVPGGDRKAIEFEFRAVAAEVARSAGVEAEVDYQPIRDAFHLDPESRVLKAFQRACAAIRGAELPEGSKPFVDDGNTFWAIAGIPAITHGPKAGGQHTIHEWVDLDDLARVAALYAAAAAIYCRESELSES